ncbi:STAS domain-containing protein [Yinghuangia sp. YIM S09857]|uniref:STAS domain-containing protein n=1 Tax=Yinghuangia sp. YIM S09857 TaxID=3436929 RepID=UPI003F52B7D7
MRHVTHELVIDRETHEGWSLLRLSGPVAGTGVAALRRALHDAITPGTPYVVADLSAVTYCDTHGFGVLVAGRRRARAADGQLRLVLGARCGRRNLDAACLTQLFPVYDDVSTAATAPPHPRKPVA